MSNQKICKFCEGADPRREKDGLIRCVKKHIFTPPNSTCSLHSDLFPEDYEESIEILRKAFMEGYDGKGL